MKICWDILDLLSYSKRTGKWYKKNGSDWAYKEFCKNCGEPFLAHRNKEKYCCIGCSSKYNNSGKKYSEGHCKNISKGLKGKPKTEEHCRNMSISLKGKNAGSKCHLWKGGYSSKDTPLYDTYASQLEWCEEVRSNKDDPNILEVKCTYCGKWYIPSLNNVKGRSCFLNDKYKSEGRFYCSEECKQECPIFWKHKWPKGFKIATSREVQPELRQLVLKRDGYQCVKCGSTESLHCHHITGVELNPIESADMDNCITLCKSCHKKIHKLPGCGYNDMKRNKC